MKIALEEAQKAYEKGEVPIGAIILLEGKIIAQSHNQSISLKDPTAHAEILALRKASRSMGNYRLTGCSLYVTIEPCLMCTGAMLNARIDCLVFGAYDSKAGAICSRHNLRENGGLEYPLHIAEGLLKEECGEIIQRFFRERRPVKGRELGKGGEVPKWP